MSNPNEPYDSKFDMDTVVELGQKAGDTLRTFAEQIVTESGQNLESFQSQDVKTKKASDD